VRTQDGVKQAQHAIGRRTAHVGLHQGRDFPYYSARQRRDPHRGVDEDGHDDASRSKAKSILGPSCASTLWGRVLLTSKSVAWELSIDMFAAAANAKLQRFMSWTDEPGSEQVDCFAARSWNSSLCPGCGQRQLETGRFFPVVEQCVWRATSDGARRLFLVPTNNKAPYWLALKRVAVLQQEIRNDSSLYMNCSLPRGRHTLFAADFSSGSANTLATQPCRQAFERWPKGRRPNREEALQLEAIQKQLQVLAPSSIPSI
jgi:hypothetical protein